VPNPETRLEELVIKLGERDHRLTPQRLAVLKEMGEVLEVGVNGGSNRYDGNRPYPHPHLICTECGATEDLEVRALNGIPRQVAQDHRLPDCEPPARLFWYLPQVSGWRSLGACVVCGSILVLWSAQPVNGDVSPLFGASFSVIHLRSRADTGQRI
jgi:hypothetical protein